MDLMELIATRHSVRDYLPDPIPEEILKQILEAGRLAPSARNRQPWRYIVFTSNDDIKELSLRCGLIGLSNIFIRKAPCLIVACADTNYNVRINHQDYYLLDTAISVQQMVLTAWSFGIGSCWIAAFSEKTLKKYLQLPDSWRIVALLPLGYPAEKKTLYTQALSVFPKSKNRLSLDKIVTYYHKSSS